MKTLPELTEGEALLVVNECAKAIVATFDHARHFGFSFRPGDKDGLKDKVDRMHELIHLLLD